MAANLLQISGKSTLGVAHDASIAPGTAGSTVAKASGTVITVGGTVVVVDIRMALSQDKNTRSVAFLRGFLSGSPSTEKWADGIWAPCNLHSKMPWHLRTM